MVVVGGGHAGIEAAAASARSGATTLLVTLRVDRIGHLPCNCSVGGPAKGHLAREVDALDGLMARASDATMTHLRRVGTGKGPAVQTLRSHVCKTLYPQWMQHELARTPNLTIREAMVQTIRTNQGRVSAIGLVAPGDEQGVPEWVEARAVVITTGTFLNGLCHCGDKQTVAAREGDLAVRGLASFLRDLGVELRRFKTGTTPRLDKASLKLDDLELQPSEPEAGPMSFMPPPHPPLRELLPCWQTWTNSETHNIIRDNLHTSAMFSGSIQGIGPRYCPSIEDKVVRFADKDSHPIFLEQEEWDSPSIYVQGFSTSLPLHVQETAVRSIRGLEDARFLRPGYAVEYDMANPLQLDLTLQSKLLKGLFFAGQINGTSGYEEAAAQGLVAGLNSAAFALGKEHVLFPRTESFLGVMIDDLVTKGVEDPYRMLTARAEHRLLLRHDNADLRLTPVAWKAGACSKARWERFEAKQEAITRGKAWLDQESIGPGESDAVTVAGSTLIKNRLSCFEFLRRPEVEFSTLALLGRDFPPFGWDAQMQREIQEQLKLEAIYEGYIAIQSRQAADSARIERMHIPETLDFQDVPGLSFESRDKLGRFRPITLGQASRISGVRPPDIAVLYAWLKAGAS